MRFILRLKEALKETWQITIPHGKCETTIFAASLIWFLCFSLYFASIVDFSEMTELMGYDSKFYIGGDYPKLMLSKILSWNLRHPIFVIINYPLLIIDYFLPNNLHVALFALFSSLLFSFSNTFIYKICKELKIEQTNGILSIILYSTFAHIILLSGQAETFVFTITFCLLMIVLALKKKSNFVSDNIIFAILTGVTLTNCIYFFIIKLWENAGAFKKSMMTTIKSSFLFIPLFGLTFLGLVYRIIFKHIPIKDAILNDTYKFIHSDINLLDVTWKHYFAEPFLFHYTDQVVLTQNAEVLPDYPFTIYNLIILFVLIFALVWGGLFNYKTVISKICASFFLYNIIIHFVCGYGNNELQLFCGHWIFFIPILVAMGLNSLKKLSVRYIFQVLFLAISLLLVIHNGYCYITSINACK